MKFEYYVMNEVKSMSLKDRLNNHTAKLTEILNELGSQGWELVCIDKDEYIFRRLKV